MMYVGCHIAVHFHGADCLSFCRKLLIFRKYGYFVYSLQQNVLDGTRALGTFQEKLTYKIMK